MTRANKIGVSNGTTSSRGVRALSWSRRRTSVASGPNGFLANAGSGRTSSGVMAVIGSFRLGGGAQLATGELEVDVVERGLAGRDRRGAHAGAFELDDRIARGPLVERHGHRRADSEGVGSGDPVLSENGEGGRSAVVDAQFQKRFAKIPPKRARCIEGDDRALVHDCEPVAEALRFVEVVGGEQNRGLRPVAQSRD